MKRLLIAIAFLCLPLASWGWYGAQVVGSVQPVSAAPASYPSPDYRWDFEQNGTATTGGVNFSDVNTVTYTAEAKQGSYSLAATTSGYLRVSNDTSLGLGSDYTIAFWTKLSTSERNVTVLLRGDYTDGGYAIKYGSSAPKITVSHRQGSSAESFLDSSSNMVTGQWYHVVVSYKRATGQCSIYVSSATFGDKTNITAALTANVVPATKNVDVGASFSGTGSQLIDDLMIWSGVALTALEAQALYESY